MEKGGKTGIYRGISGNGIILNVINMEKLGFSLRAALRGTTHANRTDSILPSHEFSAHAFLPQVCRSIRRQSQSPKFHMYGSVPVHGICAVDIQGESARYRDLFTSNATKVVPYGFSWANCAQHFSRCQRKP